MIDRRSFIKVVAPFALGFPAIVRSQSNVERRRFNDDDLPSARELLLNLVNGDRAKAGLSQLRLDDLANKVATDHAKDMAQGRFLSHWGRDGRKPYHRYAFAGGIEAVQENASAAHNIQSLTAAGVLEDLRDMHTSMMAEVPPNDGHRKTILFPFHTHVGFGMAFNGYHLRLDELFLARYIHLDTFPREAKGDSTVTLSGRLLNASHFIQEVDIFFEPLPVPPEIDWLRIPRPVSFPERYTPLRPKAPHGLRYLDGTRGDFEWERGGKFSVPIKLRKEPGIHTIVFFVRRVPSDKGFPGAQVCILTKS
jgi:uncharacterized protein YkwD